MLRRILYAIVVLIVAARADAGSFTVNPVRIELSPARPYSVLRITNLADEPVTIQAHVERWEADGAEALIDDVLLSPPIRTIASGQTQFIRLGLRSSNRSVMEQAYRLILEEVPRPIAVDFSGLRTVLKVRVPIFSKPIAAVAPHLSWEAWPTATGLHVAAFNRGNAHIQVRRLILIDKNGKQSIIATPSYVLPNESAGWTVDNQQLLGAAEVRLIADTDAGGIDEVVLLKPRQ